MKAKPFLFMAGLVVITVAAMVVADKMNAAPLSTDVPAGVKSPWIDGQVRLVQSKVLKKSDGHVAVEVTLTSKAADAYMDTIRRPVDLVIVLDRSGSMSGEKIDYAKAALVKLLGDLTETDRLALVSYSNNAVIHSGLTAMTPQNRRSMRQTIAGINVGGGTNLGAGLMAGIDLMPRAEDDLTIRHLILISDGLANQGLTDPMRLGKLAAQVGRKGVSVGTVGVGVDFNEQLLTLLADQGQGRYYFLENPVAFAGLFTEAYRNLGQVAATDLRLRLEAGPHATLVDAAGYPLERQGKQTVIRTGNIGIGAVRTLYLTFQVPTHQTATLSLGRMVLSYRHKGRQYALPLESNLTVACVEDSKDVWASVEKERWTRKVLENDFNRLKKEVAEDISAGDEHRAMERLDAYHSKQAAANAVIKSSEIGKNLEEEVGSLRDQIRETFSGAPDQVRQKQKSAAKSLHYEGYKGQRSVK